MVSCYWHKTRKFPVETSRFCVWSNKGLRLPVNGQFYVWLQGYTGTGSVSETTRSAVRDLGYNDAPNPQGPGGIHMLPVHTPGELYDAPGNGFLSG